MSFDEAVKTLQDALRYLEGTPRNAQQRQRVPWLVRCSREALENLLGEAHFHRGRAASFLKESRERGERIAFAFRELRKARREAKRLRHRVAKLERVARLARESTIAMDGFRDVHAEASHALGLEVER